MAGSTHTVSQGHRKLLLACGNPLRSDDGVGWKIAEAMERQAGCTCLRTIVTQQLTPELAENIRDADLVVFVDASATTPAGELTVFDVTAAVEAPRIFTHHLPPASLLAFARDLYGKLPGHALAITVGGASFDLGESLSNAVLAAVPKAVAALNKIFAEPV